MDTDPQPQPDSPPAPHPAPEPQPSPHPAPAAQPAPQPSQPKKTRKWVYAGILILAFGGGFALFSFSPLTELVLGEPVQEGDTVTVLYVAKLENGSVFDTNIEAVAQASGIAKPAFEPLVFTVGSGQLIPGVEEGVVGMRTGGKKTVTIPPEKAYGQPDPLRLVTSPRTTEFNRTENISPFTSLPADRFLQLFGVKAPGEEFNFSSLSYRVVNTTDGTVTARLLLQPGQVIRFPGFAWNSTVVAVSENQAMLRHGPGEHRIQTEFGNTTIIYQPEKILVTANPQAGMVVPIQGSPVPGTVVEVTEESITIDLNHPLAGKTLVFEIQVTAIS